MSKAAELAALIGSQTALSNRNLIINGAMTVDQRNATTTMGAVTYGLDRFTCYTSHDGVQTMEQSTDAPVGFKNSLKVTTTTADATLAAGQRSSVIYRVEAQDNAHLEFGTANAKTITLSFYVKSSITGTHGGAFGNGADNRNYPFTYTISTANTWERKTITIAGDTSGTWATDNGRGLQIVWGLGVGSTYSGTAGAWAAGDINSATGATTGVTNTLNATWFLTGVQLEVGETATPFEHRSFADEWDRCQRYCTVYNMGGGNAHPENLVKNNHTVPGSAGHVDVTNRAEWYMSYPVKRVEPTITVTDPSNMRWLGNGSLVKDGSGSVSFPVGTSRQVANVFQSCASTWATSVVPEGWVYKNSGTNPSITIDAEL